MSLLDAPLLDPQRIDVWVLPRNDGAVGTGTQTDPLDTSPQLATKLPINLSSGLTYTGTEATAAVTNTYSNNDIVVITGAADPAFNGIFVIYNVSSSAFKYHMDSVPPSSMLRISPGALKSSTGTRNCESSMPWRDASLPSL